MFSGRSAILHLVADLERMQQRGVGAPALAEIDHAELAVAFDQRAGELVGGAGEIGDEQIGRAIVDFVGRADLQQLAVAHHADAIAEHDRLGLIVRHVKRGHAGLLEDDAKIVAQPQAQFGIEIGQRLVQQQQAAAGRRCCAPAPRAASARPTTPPPAGRHIRTGRPAPAPPRPCGRPQCATAFGASADRSRSAAPSYAATPHRTGTPCRCRASAAAPERRARATTPLSRRSKSARRSDVRVPPRSASVVVLPQPDGPSSTTISPAGTAKLTPSIAGRPIANCFRRSETSSVAVMTLTSLFARRSLPIPEGLVPIRDPFGVQFHDTARNSDTRP